MTKMLLNNDIAQPILNRIVLLLPRTRLLRKHIPTLLLLMFYLTAEHLITSPPSKMMGVLSTLKLLSFSRSYHSSSNLQQALTLSSLMGVGIDSQIPRSEKDLNLL